MKKFAERISFPVENLTEKVLNKAHSIPGIISLAGGTPLFRVDRKYIKLLGEQLKHNQKIFQYAQSSQGDIELRELIASDITNEFGYDRKADSILVCNGSTAGLMSVFMSLVGRGDEVIVFSPHWSVYDKQCSLAGGKMLELELQEDKRWRVDFDRLDSLLSGKTKMILLADPGNPTGTAILPSEKTKLLEWAAKNDLLILADETYMDLVYDKNEFKSIGASELAKERVIICRSFSKGLGLSGFRIGYMAADEKIMKVITQVHLAMNLMTATMSQQLVKLMYRDMREIIRKNTEQLRERKKVVFDRLRKLEEVFSCIEPDGGYFAFPKIKSGANSMNVVDDLINNGVLVRPGVEFGAGGENHIRISFTTDKDSINSAFDRMENYFL